MLSAELARRAGVSPAYVSLIEKGLKVPSEEVAEAIARALEDGADVYRAWARAARFADPRGAAADLSLAADWWDDRRLRFRISSGKDLESAPAEPLRPTGPTGSAPRRRGKAVAVRGQDARAKPGLLLDSREEGLEAVRDAASRASQPASGGRSPLEDVPVLEAGVDPLDRDPVPERLVIDRMLVDRRLVAGPRFVRPFAFRADAAIAARVPDEVREGDWVLVSREVGRLAPATVYLVRLRKGLVLSRLVHRDDRILLLPAPGSPEIDEIPLEKGEAPERRIAGEVAVVVRSGR
jgi:transcriptional regulator with XRE-family HTH domain